MKEIRKEINAVFFVIPNMISTIKEADMFRAHWYDKDGEKYEIPLGEPVVQIWTATANTSDPEYSEHWQNHGYPRSIGYENAPENGHNRAMGFSSYIPLSKIVNLEEGQLLTFKFGATKVRMKARQLRNRYGRYGTFQEALKNAIPWDLWDDYTAMKMKKLS